MARRQRLDLELVARGLAGSRQQAQQLIRSGRVRSGDRVLDKPGVDVAPELALEVEQPPRFVSRGGEKLVVALQQLPIQVAGRVCLDAGISTGGFTDCLLQHGARHVYGIDVGYGQTAWSLRTDPRVVLRERTNLRHLTPAELYGPEDPWPDLAVADVSFISLTRVLPALGALLRPALAAADGGEPAEPRVEALLLVKPQFEVGRGRVGKGGVVRDPAAHVDAIETVLAAAIALGWEAAGLVASPITGPAGNHEYLLWLRRQANPAAQEASGSPAAAEGRAVDPAAEGGPLDSAAELSPPETAAPENAVACAAEDGGPADAAADGSSDQAAEGREIESTGVSQPSDRAATGRSGSGGSLSTLEASGVVGIRPTLASHSPDQPPACGSRAWNAAVSAPVDRASIRALVQRTLRPK